MNVRYNRYNVASARTMPVYHILQRRKYIRGLPIIRPPRTIYLIHLEFWIVDSVNYTLILDGNARVVSVIA